MLRQIRQAFTRYSANAPEFPVSNPPLFTGALSKNPCVAVFTHGSITIFIREEILVPTQRFPMIHPSRPYSTQICERPVSYGLRYSGSQPELRAT